MLITYPLLLARLKIQVAIHLLTFSQTFQADLRTGTV